MTRSRFFLVALVLVAILLVIIAIGTLLPPPVDGRV
jgi:hypothetical protein